MPFERGDNGLYLRDHFYSNDVVTDNNIGELGWQLTTIGNASTYAYLATTGLDANSLGVLRTTTANTADGDGTATHLFPDGLVVNPGMWFKARVRFPDITGNQIANNNARIGFSDSVTATAPTVGITFDIAGGVITARTDSADHGDESTAAAGISTLTSGTTMVLGTWHTLEALASGEANAQGGPDEVVFWVDGEYLGTVVSNIDNDEEVELSFLHWQDTGGAATLEFDIDYFLAYVPHPAGPSA